MSVSATGQMLDEDDLGPADRALLDLLQEGRITAPFAADEADYSLQYVRDRLARLVEHGNARKVYEGLYELVEDPRESDSTPAEGDTGAAGEPAAPDTAGASGAAADAREGDVLEREMEGTLERLEIPGRPDEVKEVRREAAAWAWRWLRKQGEARPRAIANATLEEFEQGIGYSASESRYDGYQLWDGYLRDALRELPCIAPQGQTWSFLEPEEPDA